MTGTGTQNDPYIVDTWSDFITAIGTSGVYVKVADDTVWDMNSIAPEGITSLNFNCTELDGNNAVIRNLYFRAQNEYGWHFSNNIHDISFINFLYEQSQSNYAHYLVGTSNSLLMQRINLSGIIKGTKNQCIFEGTRYEEIKNCSLNLKMLIGSNKVYISDSNRSAAGYYENNHIVIDAVNAQIYNSDYGIHNDNSLVEIVRAEGYSEILPRSNARSTIVRYDKGTEREKNYVFDTTGAWHEVTSAQLQDVEYLWSIGFPIGVDDV